MVPVLVPYVVFNTMVICEGKTKRIVQGENSHEIILETRDDLTGGDAAKKATISGISVFKTRQTRNVFQLLEKNGIPTSYISQKDDTSLVCHSCDMLPLELVTRRFAWGSYLKRAPDLCSTPENPHRFSEIKTEFFHKHAVVAAPLAEQTCQMEEGDARSRYLKDGVWQQGVYTDPLIVFGEHQWALHNPKAPVNEDQPLLNINPVISSAEAQTLIDDIMIPTFSVLEKAWSNIETVGGAVALVDMKIEVGRRKLDGKLVLADVIDNDSWRIWPNGDPRKQLDKQCFREDNPLSEVAEKYELVANLTDQFLT